MTRLLLLPERVDLDMRPNGCATTRAKSEHKEHHSLVLQLLNFFSILIDGLDPHVEEHLLHRSVPLYHGDVQDATLGTLTRVKLGAHLDVSEVLDILILDGIAKTEVWTNRVRIQFVRKNALSVCLVSTGIILRETFIKDPFRPFLVEIDRFVAAPPPPMEGEMARWSESSHAAMPSGKAGFLLPSSTTS
jgi:hypothetical protein